MATLVMRASTLLLLCALGHAAWAEETEWDSARDWAREAAWRDDSFAPELADDIGSGEWKIRATISLPEEHGGRRAYFVLRESKPDGLRFTFRASLIDVGEQIALLHAVHPEWSLAEIGEHLLFAEIQIAQDTGQSEVVRELERLLEVRAPILPDHPGSIFLHPTTYCVEALDSPGVVRHRYCAVDFGGQPEEIEDFLSRGLEYHPLAVGLCRLHNDLAQRWRDQQEQDGLAQLRARIDLPALGVRLLRYALNAGWGALATRLVDWGLDVRRPDPAGSWALVEACWAGHLDLVQRMLDGGAPVTARHASSSPLSAAARSGNQHVVRLLLDRGAARAEQDWGTVFLSAAAGGNPEVLEQIAAVETNPHGDAMLLYVACGEGHLAMVQHLVEQGAAITRDTLEAAARSGRVELVEWLTHPARLSKARDRQDVLDGALVAAVEVQSPGMVRVLIDRGADVNGRRSAEYCRTALAAARDVGRDDIATLLIAAGAHEAPAGAQCGE